MSGNSYILAHDLGTTGNKATLFDAGTGRTVAAAFRAYETSYANPGWAEQDPADWWRAARESTRELLEASRVAPGDVAVVSFSGMMMAALPVDGAGLPLRLHLLNVLFT